VNHIDRVRGESIDSTVTIFPGALGDLLLALPALRALRSRHVRARATLVVNGALRGVAALAGIADATVALESAESAALFAGERLPAWLDGRPLVHSWLGADDADFRARVTAAACEAHFHRIERGDGAVHAAIAYARAVGAPANLGALAADATIRPGTSAAADRLLAGDGAPVLALHPGAGARAKRWDVAGFVQLAHWWRAGGGRIVAIAGPAEAGEPPALGSPEVREWPLDDVARVLSRAALYVGNDSGISHLAGAVGARGVVLFGPTDPRRWRPLGRRLVALCARGGGPDGISLGALPAARVIAACRRRFTLTRGDPDTSVDAIHQIIRSSVRRNRV
jgi:ADP-heptose:LPS heptosyltransferase